MSVPAADPRRCVGCARPFASAVPFCPFCGAAQRPEPPAKRPAPKPVPLVPDTVRAVAPAAATAVQPAPAPEAPPAPALAPVAPVRVRPRRRARGRAWLVAAVLAGGIGAVVFSVRDPATARLVVRVHAANGAAVTAGQVLVNNVPAGPPGEPLAVAPGTMTVSFVKTGWSVDPRRVSIAGHGALTVDLAARGLPGRLALSTQPPGATVAFAGRMRGRTPFSADLDPGQYEISVALPGYVGKDVSLTVAPGEPATIAIELAPAPPRQVAAPFDRGVMLATMPLSAAPAQSADTLAVLDPGTEVQVLARVLSDPPWLQVRAGNRTGYVPASGSVEPWQVWAQRNTVSGTVDVVTPDLRVIMAGNAYPLAGVEPPQAGSPGLTAMDLALSNSLRGVLLRCMPRDPASFVCTTPDGRDVAQLYLLNGGAVVTGGALAPYAEAQRDARQQRRGVWGP